MLANGSNINGYRLFAILYFCLNGFLLPQGLLYTAILTPLLLWWLYKHEILYYIGYFFIFTIPFISIHLSNGVSITDYFRSYAMFFSSVVFGICFYFFLKKTKEIRTIFKILLWLNFLMLFVALAALYIPALKRTFWYLVEFSPGIGSFPRLKMLTYEASYYSFLFAPIAIYFYLRLLLLKTQNSFVIFAVVSIPLMLSLSLGVISGIILTFIGLFFYNPRIFLYKRSTVRILLWGVGLAVVAFLVLYIFYPGNPLFGRIRNIFSGRDTSFRGRTYESFVLAWRIAKQKSVLFGCGPGQPKIDGVAVFKNYYGYLPSVVRIPNTIGDTLATYGIVGVIIRLTLTIYFFFKARVRRNYYQLAMFLFMFIYQFTGSYLTNIVEYVAWILAFTPVFEEFDISAIKKLAFASSPTTVNYNPALQT